MKVIIAGGGKVGAQLATLLLAEQHQVSMIETRGRRLRDLQGCLPAGSMIAGSGTDPATLESAGVWDADVVAAVTGCDEVNLVVTSLARFEFGVPRTIARVKDPQNAWMFTPVMGVDVAVSQANLIAHLVAEEMSLGNMMTLLKLHKGQYSLVEQQVHPAAAAAGKKIVELNFPAECILAAVIRKGRLLIPHGDTVLQASDEVLAVVHASQAGQLASIIGEKGG